MMAPGSDFAGQFRALPRARGARSGFPKHPALELPKLAVDEHVNSNGDTEYANQNVVRYIEEHDEPADICKVAGGNAGIYKAIQQFNLASKTIFIGHELNPNSRQLLETGLKNFVIGHDVLSEVEVAAHHVAALLDKMHLHLFRCLRFKSTRNTVVIEVCNKE